MKIDPFFPIPNNRKQLIKQITNYNKQAKMMFLENTNEVVFSCVQVETVFAFTREMEETKEMEKTGQRIALDMDIARDWIKNSKTRFGKNINAAFSGPTIDSNILIPGRMIVGGYPSASNVAALKAFGVTKFVCLNDEYGNFKKNKDFPRYGDDLQVGEFIHFPIKDMSADATDESVKELCEELCDLILAGEHLFIHCAGGHGRTGTIAAITLNMLYDEYTADEIFDYIQYSHDQRKYHNYGRFMMFNKYLWDKEFREQFTDGQVPTPQTSEQRYQVVRIRGTTFP